MHLLAPTCTSLHLLALTSVPPRTSLHSPSTRMLIKSETREEYERKLQERQEVWAPAFKDYFYKRLHKEVDRNGTWAAEEFGWKGGSARANFVSNQSEHMNAVIRQRIKWRALRVDEVVHMYRDLQRAFLREYARNHTIP